MADDDHMHTRCGVDASLAKRLNAIRYHCEYCRNSQPLKDANATDYLTSKTQVYLHGVSR